MTDEGQPRWTKWDELVLRAARLSGGRRALLGIAGQPGAGKSTLAAALAAELRRRGERVALVGMDGFHIAQRALEELGLAAVKGAPETFDVAGYVALLRRLREPSERVVWAPQFRREIEDSIQSAVPVPPEVSLVITEGNYLLLGGEWAPVGRLLDEVWFVEVPQRQRRRRLAARHRHYGRSAARAWERTLGSDERNARTVATSKPKADLVVRQVTG